MKSTITKKTVPMPGQAKKEFDITGEFVNIYEDIYTRVRLEGIGKVTKLYWAEPHETLIGGFRKGILYSGVVMLESKSGRKSVERWWFSESENIPEEKVWFV